MRRVLRKTGVVAFLASALVTVFASAASAEASPSLNCDGPGTDLQNKIDGAADGATIFFFGNCDEGPYFVSGKNLHLRGAASPSPGTLSAPADSPCVVCVEFAHVTISRADILADNGTNGINVGFGGTVTTREINISCVGDEGASRAGIGVSIFGGGQGVIVNDSDDEVIIDGCLAGIDITNGSGAFVTNVTVSGSHFHGIGAQGTSNAEIHNSTITGNGAAGVFVDLNSSVVLTGANTINLNDPGVHCGESGVLVGDAATDFTGGNGGGGNVMLDLPGCHNIP